MVTILPLKPCRCQMHNLCVPKWQEFNSKTEDFLDTFSHLPDALKILQRPRKGACAWIIYENNINEQNRQNWNDKSNFLPENEWGFGGLVCFCFFLAKSYNLTSKFCTVIFALGKSRINLSRRNRVRLTPDYQHGLYIWRFYLGWYEMNRMRLRKSIYTNS